VKEVELKAVVANPDEVRERVERAGAALVYAGRLEDRRYDTGDRALSSRDHVLRVRVYRDGEGARATLDWKGPVSFEGGYKVREELSAALLDPDTLLAMLDRLGYVVSREIDREIRQYDLDGTMLRFEHYPRMDVLVEIEGTPDGIERAIAAAGLARSAFGTDRLPDFVRRFEQRTGQRAAVSQRELAGNYEFRLEDA
jgi:predicted adenylyl cyclase CyaB